MTLVLGCQREAPEPQRRTEPWPAVASVAVPAAEPRTYVIEPGGEARFEIRSAERPLRGRLGVARGTLAFDPLDLGATRAEVELDLGSARILEPEGDPERQASLRTHSWFGLEPNRPESVRERHRWARFTLRGVRNPSAAAAHEARLVRRGTLPPLHEADADGAAPSDAETDPRELRELTVDAEGALLIRGVEVELGTRLRVTFEYPVPATPGALPARLTIATARPFPVSLAAHDLTPGAADGGTSEGPGSPHPRRLGKEALVSLTLTAVPQPQIAAEPTP